MKTLQIRAALATLLLAVTVSAQQAPPPAAPQGQPPGGPRGGMPPSDQQKTFESKSLGAPVNFVAYLPADYSTSKTSYPVIYALHGMFENSAFLERRGLIPQIDELVKAGTGPTAIIVTVDGGNNLFVNSGK